MLGCAGEQRDIESRFIRITTRDYVESSPMDIWLQSKRVPTSCVRHNSRAKRPCPVLNSKHQKMLGWNIVHGKQWFSKACWSPPLEPQQRQGKVPALLPLTGTLWISCSDLFNLAGRSILQETMLRTGMKKTTTENHDMARERSIRETNQWNPVE